MCSITFVNRLEVIEPFLVQFALMLDDCMQGWRQEFSDGGLTLPTRGLKYGFQVTMTAKNLRQNRFSPSDGEVSILRRGDYNPLALPWRHP